MKISHVNYSTPAFGYNKELNRELSAKISSSEDKEWSATLNSLNQLCNQTEDRLRTAEKNEAGNDVISKYTSLFLRTKEALAALVTTTFPELNFADREQKSYWTESKKTDSDWLKQVSYVMDTYTKSSQIEKNNEAVKIDESKLPPAPDKEKSKAKTRNTDISELVEEYKPTKYSPKGFADVVGMDELKNGLSEDVVAPILDPEQAEQDFIDYEKEYPKGVLMFGPPGCGKTYITQALASEADTKMYKLSIGKAGSSYINQTSQNIKKAFDYVGKLSERSEKPILLFMDEIDSFGFDRSSRTDNEDIKQVATLLQSIDDIRPKNVILIGATNKPDLLDPAVKRRFDQKEYVGLPDEKVRYSLVKTNLEKKAKAQNLLNDEDSLNEIVKKLEGYSNNAICNICKTASLNALHRNRSDIEFQDFEKAIDECEEEKYDENDYKSKEGRKKTSRKIGFVQE